MFDEILAIFNVKTILIGLLTGYVVHWLMQRYKYKLPPGPFPLPLIGNILSKGKSKYYMSQIDLISAYMICIGVYTVFKAV